ncbi:MAG TPA: PAS domain-containing protein, partial [Chitinophaga sp.]|nr:PAS domain-containing protein [Chitinophaga sp.]
FNKSAEELSVNFYGKRMQEQQNLKEFMHHSTRDRVITCFNKALIGEKVQEDFKRDYDGHIIWWQLTFNPARDDNGEVIGVTVIMKDITEAHLYKLKIEKKNAQLERIAFIQAHELRGPLTSVQSLLALIKDEYGGMDLVYTEKLEEGLLKLDNKIKEIVALSSEHNKEL